MRKWGSQKEIRFVPVTISFVQRMRVIIVSMLVLECLTPSLAQSEMGSGRKGSRDVLDRWNAFQNFMNKKGVLFQTINTLDVLSNVSGGLHRKTATAGGFDLLLTVDGERLLRWDEATFFFYGLGLYGENPSDNVGDAQAISSIAAPNTWKLYKAWYQQNFLDDRFSLLAGLYDVTSEFDVIRSSSEVFLNSSFGTGDEFAVSGTNSPSTFPTTSLSLRGQVFSSDAIGILTVVADGIPGDPNNPNGTKIIVDEDDGIFANAEIAYYTFESERRKRRGRPSFENGRFGWSSNGLGEPPPLNMPGNMRLASGVTPPT